MHGSQENGLGTKVKVASLGLLVQTGGELKNSTNGKKQIGFLKLSFLNTQDIQSTSKENYLLFNHLVVPLNLAI